MLGSLFGRKTKPKVEDKEYSNAEVGAQKLQVPPSIQATASKDENNIPNNIADEPTGGSELASPPHLSDNHQEVHTSVEINSSLAASNNSDSSIRTLVDAGMILTPSNIRTYEPVIGDLLHIDRNEVDLTDYSLEEINRALLFRDWLFDIDRSKVEKQKASLNDEKGGELVVEQKQEQENQVAKNKYTAFFFACLIMKHKTENGLKAYEAKAVKHQLVFNKEKFGITYEMVDEFFVFCPIILNTHDYLRLRNSENVNWLIFKSLKLLDNVSGRTFCIPFDKVSDAIKVLEETQYMTKGLFDLYNGKIIKNAWNYKPTPSDLPANHILIVISDINDTQNAPYLKPILSKCDTLLWPIRKKINAEKNAVVIKPTANEVKNSKENEAVLNRIISQNKQQPKLLTKKYWFHNKNYEQEQLDAAIAKEENNKKRGFFERFSKKFTTTNNSTEKAALELPVKQVVADESMVETRNEVKQQAAPSHTTMINERVAAVIGSQEPTERVVEHIHVKVVFRVLFKLPIAGIFVYYAERESQSKKEKSIIKS